ncbi:complex I 51 kDa subunit family protein [Chitinimonas koreensis]|uniref:complex I 51 kDa subunit family protein n=1 Tax=Chitinimonas koreensis TaxID=356302 RepID=UPI0003F56D0B|nr:NADH-ubiquinone oxidoreductase-F iron-sulfur binding region domain-containing protein [Chitinimonas koreensis]QNM97895.1 NADH-quinone oxidoreductase subunit D [Chitinimonas koreensis]
MDAMHGPGTGGYYHLEHVALAGRACRGLACFAARNDAPRRWREAHGDTPPLHCLGQCYRAPAACGDDGPVPAESHARRTVLLANVGRGGVRDLAAYQQAGGGQALRQALATPRAALLDMIAASGLRGRGGAGFPAGRKWLAVARAEAGCKYLVVNADEGDPGSFSDRLLMEDDPFLLIEACLIAALAVGARRGHIYLRAEYPEAAAVLRAALAAARGQRWLGAGVLGSAHDFELELVIGQGSYVCGEETALLESIEGRRPEVRLRPPQITEAGLWGAPTLVHNVETLCAVPWIVRHGAEAYAALGYGRSRGTKLLSLNSLFRRPGLYEVEFGISLRRIVDELGGGLRRGRLKGLMVGGPLAGLIPPALLDTPLDYEAMQAIGGAVGHGGVIAFADDTSIVELVAEVFRFGAIESCGKCTPCRLGSPELAAMFEAARRGERMERDRWQALVRALAAASLCGHGRGLAEFARAIERHYPEELATCFR